MAVGADGIDWDALRQLRDAGLSDADIRKLATLNQPTQKKTPPTPVGIRIPEQPVPDNTSQIGGGLYVGAPTFSAQPISKTEPQESITPTKTGGANGASIRSLLRQYGLDELLPFLPGWIEQDLTPQEIEAMLLDWNSDVGKIVDRIYPALRKRAEAGLRRGSIAENLAFRQQTRQLLSARGLLIAFPDVDRTADDWYSGDKSLVEQTARLDTIADDVAAITAGDPVAVAELEAWERYYGAKPTLNDLVALTLNTATLPEIERRARAVGLDRAAGRGGFGDLSREEAEQLAGLDIDPTQAMGTFAELASLDELTRPLVGQSGTVLTRDDLVDAGFYGNPAARRRIERTRRERGIGVSGGGGFAASAERFAVGASGQ